MLYTIAILGDHLIATAPDGDDAMMAARLSDMDSQLFGEGNWREQLRYFSGLTLFENRGDVPEGAEVIYAGTSCGWLQDAEGRMIYEAAARLPA